MLYIIGALFYAFRFPESYFTRTFDNIGNGHNIFHVFVLVGIYVQFMESVNFYKMRKDKVCPI